MLYCGPLVRQGEALKPVEGGGGGGGGKALGTSDEGLLPWHQKSIQSQSKVIAENRPKIRM